MLIEVLGIASPGKDDAIRRSRIAASVPEWGGSVVTNAFLKYEIASFLYYSPTGFVQDLSRTDADKKIRMS
uniref:Uncharacterized protein n=1 Tax=Bionectria ochroleuca TaxID=29856 RepID=A0A0B7KHJ6_BIOOC